MVDFKVGDVINFAYRDGFALLTSVGNLLHYGQLGYTHSAIVYDVDINSSFVYLAEALDEGIQITKYELWWLNAQFNLGKIAIGFSNITPTQTFLLQSFCRKHKGEPYNFGSLWDMAVYWFTGRNNVVSTDTDWICSEFVGACLKECGIDIVKELKLPTDDYISPMDLYLSTQLNWKTGGNKND